MAKVKAPTTEELKPILAKRLKRAKSYREKFEDQWHLNEKTAYYQNSRADKDEVQVVGDTVAIKSDEVATKRPDGSEMAVNYAWKFLRFIHSQLSSNPPSVLVRPTSTDNEDRLKADAGDRVVRHGYQDIDAQELFDDGTLKTVTYGNGWWYMGWDPDAGDEYEFDEQSQELTMQGNICARSPSTWDMWADPDAKRQKDMRHVFERITMPVHEACFKWPEAADTLKRYAQNARDDHSTMLDSDWDDIGEEMIEVFRYVEKGMPINGMAGLMCWMLEDGTILGKPSKNLNPGQQLGYFLLTDIDVPDQVYGKSFIEYVYKLQDLLNRLDTAFVDQVAAHGVVRMVLPEGAEIEDESLSNSSWDYVTITGNSGVAPYFIPAAQLMPDIHKLRENLINGIQELAGVNDSMLGVQKREMSGFSMQTAIDAGSTVRRRLMNKYTLTVRDFWRCYLGLVRINWTEPRMVLVLGKEKAFESTDLKGADIDGGFDVICEYGASLSLDPARRREEIMQLMPVFEKANLPTKTILSMLRLNELDQLYDRMQMAADRQREEFEQMVATGHPIKPQDLQDHAGRLEYAYYYLETAEFKYLDEQSQMLIKQHVREREQLAKTTAVQGQPQGASAGAPAVPGAPAAPAVPQDASTAPPAEAAPVAQPVAA